MSAYILTLDSKTNEHNLTVSGLDRFERHEECNSTTRSKEDIARAVSEVESAIISTTASERWENNINTLYSLRKLYLSQRNNIISSRLKLLFYRKKLRHLDSILEDIDYKIYLFESDSIKKLIKSEKQRLEADAAYLAKMKKKYGH